MPTPININIPAVQTRQSLPSGTPTNDVVIGESVSESGTNLRRHKPPGWIPPTDYTLTSTHRRGSNGVSSIIDKFGNGTKYTGQVCASSGAYWPVDYVTNFANVAIGGDLASLLNTALIKARGNLKDMSVDLGTAFGERNQTAHLIGDTASRLAKAVRKLRHGEIRNAMRELGISSKKGAPRGSNWTNNWLELQYGWKPLLSDIYGACDALSKRDKDLWMVTAKGSARSTAQGSYSNRASGTGWFHSSSRYELGAFVRIDASPSGNPTGSLTSVGITNPLNVAWELVPYSFVVDWFIPVGAWINSLDALIGFDIRGVSCTTFQRTEWTGSGDSHTEPTGTSFTENWTAYKRFVQVQRTTSTAVPLPSFPSFKDPRSLGHMANGLALLSQAFGRR